MNQRKRKQAAAAALLTALCLTACGQSAYTEAYETSADMDAAAELEDGLYTASGSGAAGNTAAYGEEKMAVEESAAEEAPFDGGVLSQEASQARKLIKNVDLEVETRQFDTLVDQLRQEIDRLGGYVENYSVSGYAGGSARYGTLVARVPQESLDGFVGKVGEQSNITYRNESVQDVTLTYVDLDAHKKSLLTEQERLLELLEQAETVTDLVELEGRLSEVRYQIESMESQLRAIDNQVSYSTVTINISEVELYTPPAEASVRDEIVTGFLENVSGVCGILRGAAVGLIVNLPFLILWAAAILALFLVVRLLRAAFRKRGERKKNARRIGEDYEEIPPVRNGQDQERGARNEESHGNE